MKRQITDSISENLTDSDLESIHIKMFFLNALPSFIFSLYWNFKRILFADTKHSLFNLLIIFK